MVDKSRGEKLVVNIDIDFPRVPCYRKLRPQPAAHSSVASALTLIASLAVLSVDIMDISGEHQNGMRLGHTGLDCPSHRSATHSRLTFPMQTLSTTSRKHASARTACRSKARKARTSRETLSESRVRRLRDTVSCPTLLLSHPPTAANAPLSRAQAELATAVPRRPRARTPAAATRARR